MSTAKKGKVYPKEQKVSLTVKQLRDILNDPMMDESLPIGYPDAAIKPTGVEPIINVTEVRNGFNQIVGYTII